MFVNTTQYDTPIMIDINKIRYILITNFYNDPSYIYSIKEIITKYIECNNIEFSLLDYAFNVKIKKTAMRKNRDFRHNPEFYYPIVSNIFMEFLSNNRQAIINALYPIYGDRSSIVLDIICCNHGVIANLCYLTCISDNLVIIKL